jgi:hypothetical protein
MRGCFTPFESELNQSVCFRQGWSKAAYKGYFVEQATLQELLEITPVSVSSNQFSQPSVHFSFLFTTNTVPVEVEPVL